MINWIAVMLTDKELKASMISKGFTQAAKFSWKAMARHVLEIYREIGASGKVS